MSKPLVSVIMPVYQVEDFVEKSILSILNQTYKNIELICVDDASTDNSFKICKKLADEYSEIKLFHNLDSEGKIAIKNQGQESTRNFGLDRASGKYVIFVDSDDTLAPITIERAVQVAEENNSEIVLFTYSRIVDGQDYPILADAESRNYTVSELSELLLKKISWSVLSCVGSKLYRLDVLNLRHQRFNDKYKYNEDCGFILDALIASEKISFINEPFYKYLIRKKDSIMSSYRPGMFTTNLNVVLQCKQLFLRNRCFENKQLEYYYKVLMLIFDSLNNEFYYKSYNEFCETAELIESNDETTNMVSFLSDKFSFKNWESYYIRFLRKKKNKELYRLYKIRALLHKY